MQSQTTEEHNLLDVAAKVLAKLDTAPGSVTFADSSILQKLARHVQSVAAANEQGPTVQANARQSSDLNENLTPAQRKDLEIKSRLATLQALMESMLHPETDPVKFPPRAQREESELFSSWKNFLACVLQGDDDIMSLVCAQRKLDPEMRSQVVSYRAARLAVAKAPNDSINAPINQQRKLNREADHVKPADKVGMKMAKEPESVTDENGGSLHSTETREFSATEKGSIASQAQSHAAKDTGDTA